MTRAEKKAAKAAEKAIAADLLKSETTMTSSEGVSTETTSETILDEALGAQPEDEVLAESDLAEISAIAAELEGETTPPAPIEEPTPEPQPVQAEGDFDVLIAGVSADAADAKLAATVAAIAERADFEKIKDPANTKIQKTLENVHKQIATKRAARLMVVTGFDPSTLNRTIHEGARYNVYAMGKLGDAIWGLTNSDDGQKGKIANAINLACMRSLFRFRAAGVQFTGEMAKAAASDKIKVDAKVKDHLVRHTVSASTAPTQASSTMQALETLGVVKRSGSGKNPNFDLTINPIVSKLEQVLAA